MGWIERLGLRKNMLTPGQSKAVTVAGRAIAEQAQSGSAFSPGSPIQPFAGLGGRARQHNIASGANITGRPVRDNRMSFEMLKHLTESYDVAGLCIAHRINDIRSLPWNIVPADGLDANVENQIAIAKRAMRKPDGQRLFRTWLAMYLDDVFRYDAGTLVKRRDRLGRVVGLDVISGATIAPLMDYYGQRPTGDAPAFAQYVQGTVYKWFTADDVIYEPFNARSDSLYGYSPIELVLLNANTDLRFQNYFMNYFTEGSIPAAFITMPEATSHADQLREYQEIFNAYMVGDEAAKHQLKAIPFGSVVNEMKDASFDVQFPKLLMGKTCAAYKVTPNDLGFTEDVNRATGDTQVDVQFRIGSKPMIEHLQDILTGYLQDDLGLQVEFRFDAGPETESRLDTAKSDEVYIKNAVVSVDEIREKRFGFKTNAMNPTPRYVYTAKDGPIPLDGLDQLGGKVDPDTAAPLAAEGGNEPLFASLHKFPGKGTDAQATTHTHDALAESTLAGVTKSAITVSGLAVKAADTGRVLMIQRTLDPDDEAAGTWEFPGGHLEDGEEPITAALREWQEETGLPAPGGHVTASWSNGHYMGHVLTIPSEAAVPINTGDGEDGETLAWFHPDHLPGFPALREELADNLPKAELAKAMRSELSKWRSNTVGRLRRGQPARRFNGAEHLSDGLVDAVFAAVRKAKDEHDAGAIFDAAMDAASGSADPKADAPKWRNAPPNPTPIHNVDLPLTDHYAPVIQDALRGSLPRSSVRDAMRAHRDSPAINTVERVLREGLDPTKLSDALAVLHRDAYTAGKLAGQVQTGTNPDALKGWTVARPGVAMTTDLGWADALNASGIAIHGIEDTTLEAIGHLIVDGVADGASVDRLARQINNYLDDPTRAQMIAHTESARMLSLGSRAAYMDAGVTQWDWVVSDGVCPRCLARAESNPHGMDEAMPPGHPYCRCAAAPRASSILNPLTGDAIG